MNNKKHQSILGIFTSALAVMLCSLFIDIVGFLEKQETEYFNNTKIPVNIKKIEQVEQIYSGKSIQYQATVHFNYSNDAYKTKAVITESEYLSRESLQQSAGKTMSMYFSPLSRQVYSQAALEKHLAHTTKTGFYFTTGYAVVSLLMGWLIIVKAVT